MSNQYNTAWQKTERDKRYKRTLNNAGRTTWVREVSRLEWGKSSCTVFYRVGNYECKKNIIKEIRKYAGRLNQEKRDKISKATPECITVIRDNELCYMQGCPYNMGIRSYYSLDEREIREWVADALS
ncbi:hypothetical protein J6V85_01775 [Candidatus Saccharibacteria bacterium]|nr:hypothetical protein [Candidatus Saccharibacteria bacterium]